MSGDDDGESTRLFEARPAVAAPSATAHSLEIIEGPQRTRLMLRAATHVIGRGRDADLKVDSEELSRSHAKLDRKHGEYSIHDLGSRNGIFLNGLRIHSAVLRDGDILQLGDVQLRYREGS
jgi:pSer/pThr/pTyr-binding forkhead associated (FHA) protein